MDKEILDLAELLMNKLEEEGYSTVNNAGFKNVEIQVFKDKLVIENVTTRPQIRIARRL